MRIKRSSLCISLVLMLLLLIGTVKAGALNTGLSTEELSQEKIDTFLSNTSIKLLTSEPEKRDFLYFDVNEQGLIAICQDASSSSISDKVCIYNTAGEFVYGYAFQYTGSFRVEWDNENINILFIRSSVVLSLDSGGNVLDIKGVQDIVDNSRYINYKLESSRKVVGDKTYTIRNDMWILNWVALSYSQVVVVDIDGTESIIYDVNTEQLIRTIVILCFVIAFISIVVVVLVRQIIKLNRED